MSLSSINSKISLFLENHLGGSKKEAINPNEVEVFSRINRQKINNALVWGKSVTNEEMQKMLEKRADDIERTAMAIKSYEGLLKNYDNRGDECSEQYIMVQSQKNMANNKLLLLKGEISKEEYQDRLEKIK